MANRFIGGVLSSRPQANTPFSSRASTGTYFDSAGVLRTAPINQPRLNYNLVGGAWTQPSVLIEPASTNALLYSQDFSNANWELSSQNSVLTANSITAPDGTVTASTISNNSSNGYHRFYQPLNSFTQRTSYSFSVFLKYKDHQYVSIGLTDNSYYRSQIVVNLVAGTITQNYIDAYSPSDTLISTITSVGNGWYRLTGVYIPAIAIIGNLYWLVILQQNSTFSSGGYVGTGTGFYIWGAQAEINSLGATSYIPTTSAAITRAADVVGPGTSGIYSLEDRQTTTATDDQATVTSFTSTGSTTWTAPLDVVSVEVLVVAGGGSAGSSVSSYGGGGGGGAGGLIYNTSYPVVPNTTYSIAVGAGASAVSSNTSTAGTNGQNSQFGNIVAIGGGGGGSGGAGNQYALAGGSGGGGGYMSYSTVANGGQSIATQGYIGAGVSSVSASGAGGGGAGGPGKTNTGSGGGVPGAGGPGLPLNISGATVTYAVGGSGGDTAAGLANTGNGGSAPYAASTNLGSGGSGIVVIKYKRTPRQITSTSNAAVVVQKFNSSNLWTVPAGVTSVEALVVAGGGGGGNGTAGGGAGAGGVVYNSALAVTPGSTYTIGVGGGGKGAGDQASPSAYNGFGSGIGTGSELITNGSAFTVTTGWTATTATLSVPQTGTFRITPNASVNGTASQSITTTNGVTYVAVVRVTSDVTKNFRLRIGTTQVGAEIADFFTSYTRDSLDNGVSGAGFYSVTFTATGSTTWINMQIGGGTQQATDISYISVRQATLPTVGGGRGASEGDSGSNTGGSGGGGVYGQAGSVGTAGQGNAGGSGYNSVANIWTGGGGGGAGSAGGTATTFYPGYGGAGVAYAITGNLEYYGGGGGGSSQNAGVGTVYPGLGGIGGGGTGAADQTSSTVVKGGDGASNTGGGGGAQANAVGSGNSGHGGSGVVVLRYRVPQVVTFLDTGAWTCPAGVTNVQALVVAGGGSGGSPYGGGGGAGGLIYNTSYPVTPGQTYPVVVGAGGSPALQSVGAAQTGKIGGNSQFANLIAIGGGAGGMWDNDTPAVGSAGGSGGGGGAKNSAATGAVGGIGTYGQGNAGATGIQYLDRGAGGGGGAGGAGFTSVTATVGGAGGPGLQFGISGTPQFYAGGGGGGVGSSSGTYTASAGGSGVGGNGGFAVSAVANSGTDGATNTGSGGGGASGTGNGATANTMGNSGAGGSGVVILRWSGA